jgi:hypothetical protein
MTTLYSYCVRDDSGVASNPFWGICTLVICKPRIRRTAQVGDWVVGTGSRRSPVGDLSGAVVYAMRVGRKMSMPEYDKWAAAECSGKIPDLSHEDRRRACGDAAYDFSTDPPRVRPSDHTEENREHDLSGIYALLADQFVYFGREAVPLPPELRGVVKRGPGHRSVRDRAIIDRFTAWLAGLGHPWGSVVALPARWPPRLVTMPRTSRSCAPTRPLCFDRGEERRTRRCT